MLRMSTATSSSSSPLVPDGQPIQIGAIVYPNMDQMDLTGPFAALSRLPGTTFQLLWKSTQPVRDFHGFRLTPDASFADAKPMDVLLVPGGPGQNELMEDEELLNFIRTHAEQVKILFTVCTGALLLGATGLLKGRRATSYWRTTHLLKYFGAEYVNERVVTDGKFVNAAGLTAGIDGALRVAAMLRGEEAGKRIELDLQYAPEPPFHCGSPDCAPAALVATSIEAGADLTARRLAVAKRVAAKLGVRVED
jgi:cyclohexyl-isocyanide hydratase